MAIPELTYEPRQLPTTGHFSTFAPATITTPHRWEMTDVGVVDPFAYFSSDFQQLRPFTPILPAILSSSAVSPRTKSYLARDYETQFWQAVFLFGTGLHAQESPFIHGPPRPPAPTLPLAAPTPPAPTTPF